MAARKLREVRVPEVPENGRRREFIARCSSTPAFSPTIRSRAVSLRIITMIRVLLFVILWMTAPVNAQQSKAGDVVIRILDPSVEEAEKGQATAQGSIEIRNQGDMADKLYLIIGEFAERAKFDASSATIGPGKRILVPIVFKIIYRKLSEPNAYYGVLFFEHAGKVGIRFWAHRRTLPRVSSANRKAALVSSE